jgi:hypothetical protein
MSGAGRRLAGRRRDGRSGRKRWRRSRAFGDGHNQEEEGEFCSRQQCHVVSNYYRAHESITGSFTIQRPFVADGRGPRSSFTTHPYHPYWRQQKIKRSNSHGLKDVDKPRVSFHPINRHLAPVSVFFFIFLNFVSFSFASRKTTPQHINYIIFDLLIWMLLCRAQPHNLVSPFWMEYGWSDFFFPIGRSVTHRVKTAMRHLLQFILTRHLSKHLFS